jgi:hypothetical protein
MHFGVGVGVGIGVGFFVGEPMMSPQNPTPTPIPTPTPNIIGFRPALRGRPKPRPLGVVDYNKFTMRISRICMDACIIDREVRDICGVVIFGFVMT